MYTYTYIYIYLLPGDDLLDIQTPCGRWGFQDQVRMHSPIRSKLDSLVSSHLSPRVHPPWNLGP